MSNPLPRPNFWAVLAVSMILFVGVSQAATKASVAKMTLKPIEKKATFEIAIVNQTVQGISVTIK